jgi:hypothetical protein
MVLTYFLPMSLMTATYTAIGRELWGQQVTIPLTFYARNLQLQQNKLAHFENAASVEWTI